MLVTTLPVCADVVLRLLRCGPVERRRTCQYCYCGWLNGITQTVRTRSYRSGAVLTVMRACGHSAVIGCHGLLLGYCTACYGGVVRYRY